MWSAARDPEISSDFTFLLLRVPIVLIFLCGNLTTALDLGGLRNAGPIIGRRWPARLRQRVDVKVELFTSEPLHVLCPLEEDLMRPRKEKQAE